MQDLAVQADSMIPVKWIEEYIGDIERKRDGYQYNCGKYLYWDDAVGHLALMLGTWQKEQKEAKK